MSKPKVIWVVLEMIPDGNGLDDIMPYLFHTERDAKKAADWIQDASDSDVEFFSLPIQEYKDWNEDFTAGMGEESEEEDEEEET